MANQFLFNPEMAGQGINMYYSWQTMTYSHRET